MEAVLEDGHEVWKGFGVVDPLADELEHLRGAFGVDVNLQRSKTSAHVIGSSNIKGCEKEYSVK